MRASEIFPSKYLKADELDQDYIVTIAEVVLESLEQNDGTKVDKPVIYFKEWDKGLVCNKTNFGIIAQQHGDDTDLWLDKKITLTVMDVQAFGEVVQAIRVKSGRKPAPAGGPGRAHQHAAGPGRANAAPAAAAAGPAQSVSEPASLPGAAADDVVTAFWTEARRLGFDRKTALELVVKEGGDFVKAQAALAAQPF